jgi:hypothetical protein
MCVGAGKEEKLQDRVALHGGVGGNIWSRWQQMQCAMDYYGLCIIS